MRDKLDIFFQCLHKENPSIRINAIDALTKLDNDLILEPLIKMLDHDDALVQWYAIVTLGEIGDERALPHLIQLQHKKEIFGEKKGMIIAALKNAVTKIGSSNC
jgi:HEAT repeat protein